MSEQFDERSRLVQALVEAGLNGWTALVSTDAMSIVALHVQWHRDLGR